MDDTNTRTNLENTDLYTSKGCEKIMLYWHCDQK